VTRGRMVGWLYDDGARSQVSVVVFDKDGTLLDFAATWLPAFRAAARRVAHEAGEAALEPALLKVGGWVEDPEGPRIAHNGLMLHGTNEELAQAWIDTQPMVAEHFERDCARLSELVRHVYSESIEPTPLGPTEHVLRQLRDAGLKLAVVTNDDEAFARAQFDRLGWTDLFECVIGADSGHGPKPGTGGILAAIKACGVEPQHAVMVGDAEGDMVVGRNAGCAFSVAIWPDGEALPAGHAIAACRMPTIAQLPATLAVTGHMGLRRQARAAIDSSEGSAMKSKGSASFLGDNSPGEEVKAAEEAKTAAAAAAAAVDPDIIRLVEGLLQV